MNNFSLYLVDLQVPFERTCLDHHNKEDKRKWQLLLWMLAIDDDLLADIKKMKTHFVAPVITLLYLVEVSSREYCFTSFISNKDASLRIFSYLYNDVFSKVS